MMKELLAHVAEMNAKAQAWMDDAQPGEFRAAAIFTEEDIKDRCTHYDVHTPADWDALCAWEDYFDVYKDVNGISPRWTRWSDNTAEGWQEAIAAL